MTILDERSLDFISTSVEQTIRLGVRLGELLRVGDCLCLSGELGTGKTALAQGIGRGWGAGMRVTSPTFTLVNEYPRLRDGRLLYHIDCYRLESPGEVVTAGVSDILEDRGAIMIEWAERIQDILPESRLWIDLRHVSETRRGLRFQADGERPLDLLNQFRKSAFGL
jgi:tRNA threonylcarbamoyladenosine biosynthesis protein TsaE